VSVQLFHIIYDVTCTEIMAWQKCT